jgi:hypothetical protein
MLRYQMRAVEAVVIGGRNLIFVNSDGRGRNPARGSALSLCAAAALTLAILAKRQYCYGIARMTSARIAAASLSLC